MASNHLSQSGRRMASAMDRDRSHHTHGSLYDVLHLEIRSIRREYNEMVREIHIIFNMSNQGRDYHLYPYHA